MLKTIPIALLFIASSVLVAAQPKVYVAPMEEGFDAFLSAAILDNEVPIAITADECAASFVISGGAVRGQNKWYDVVFGAERDRNQGSIKVLRVSDRSVVWAGAAGDRSLWWGALKSGGQKKVANRLAREMKKGYFNRSLTDSNTGTCEGKVLRPASGQVLIQPSGSEAIVELTSSPDGSEVEVGGKLVGKTPLTLNLKPGEHTITVRASGYRAWVKFIRLQPGEASALAATLTRH